jgi:hypothetical protein
MEKDFKKSDPQKFKKVSVENDLKSKKDPLKAKKDLKIDKVSAEQDLPCVGGAFA